MAEGVPLKSAEIISLHDIAPVPMAPLPAEEDGGGKQGGGGPPAPPDGLPEGCPVTPLGMSADGKRFFYLDAGQRLVDYAQKDHSRLGILGLFNERYTALMDYWPRLTKVLDAKTKEVDWQVTGWKPERAAEELIAACGRRGTLNIADRVRGPGAWLGPEGELIVHCGDRVLFGREWKKPGELAGIIYPAHARTPLPSEQIAPGGSGGPAQAALELFRHWPWDRPDTDPYLLLGALGAAKIGGALKWRPTVWVTGEGGSGKSTLLTEYLAPLFGEAGVNITVETSAAGIWQTSRQSSHPVLLDEAEADPWDPRRMGAIVRLARAASSGGVIFRGGSEHSPVHFVIRSCFIFGSILVPPLMPQDKSRIAVLSLGTLQGIKPPAISGAKLKAMGEALTRRMIDGWPRLAAVYERYREALAEHGHRARSADQYGILLACADLLLSDSEMPDTDTVAEWCERLPPEREAAKDHQNCVVHLLTAAIDPHRGGARHTIAEWIGYALLPSDHSEHRDVADVNRALGSYGLAIEFEPMPKPLLRVADDPGAPLPEPVRWLYVANSHRGLAQLFEGSHWGGQSGTTSPWVQALRRVPLAEYTEPDRRGGPPLPLQRRLGGIKARCTRLPLDYLLNTGQDSE